MKKLIIDSRMRQIEKDILISLGYNLILIQPHPELYEEISAHPDIQLACIQNLLVQAPNSNFTLNNSVVGLTKIGAKYPASVPYNVCCIGNYLVHHKYTDKKILEIANRYSMKLILVKQGYTKCSIAVTSENSCITTDKQIYEKLVQIGVDCLYIEEPNICLINKNGDKSYMKGFIGGATALLENKFILFGDKEKLINSKEIETHLKKYHLKFIYFPGLPIYDYGGVMEMN